MLVLPAVAWNGVAAAAPVREGVVYAFQSGNVFEWKLPEGEYLVVVRAGADGAEVDRTGLRIPNDPHPSETMVPYGGYATKVAFSGEETKSLMVKSGSGKLLVARMDLSRLPVGRVATRLDAQGTVGPDECRAFYFQTLGISKNYQMSATGEGVQFTFYDARLSKVSEAMGELSGIYDANVYEFNGLLVQACSASQNAEKAFHVYMDYPAPASSSRSAPAETAALVLLAGLFLVAGMRLAIGR